MYLDANNLYKWAMSQYLPTGGFKWLSEGEINNTNLKIYTGIDIRGWPWLSWTITWNSQWLPIRKKLMFHKAIYPIIVKDHKTKFQCKHRASKKLVPTLLTKTKYVLHYRNLQLYMDLELKLKKVQRALQLI